MSPLSRAILRVFLPFAAGYFLSYLFRVVNAVIAPDLMTDVQAGPSALGLLTAAYFIACAVAQLPIGIVLDRYGPRRVECVLLLVAAFGSWLFARAESVSGLILGRTLIGAGVSSCLMAAMKAYLVWFQRETLPMVTGFQMAAGGIGALVATSPVHYALHFTNWRGIFIALALLTLLSAMLIYLIVPERKITAQGETLFMQMVGVREILTSRRFWRIAPLNSMCQASFLAIQGLWLGPWLLHVGGLERQEVAHTLFWVAASMAAGYACLGVVANRLSRRGIAVEKTAVGGMVLFICVQICLLIFPPAWSFPLWMAFTFFGTSGIISYSSLSQAFPVHLSARVTTSINMLAFSGAFFAQWLIGICVDLLSPEAPKVLTAAGFRLGFGLMLALELLGLCNYMFSLRHVVKIVAKK